MRILLIGEYSNLHWTLAEGLREEGHHVVVISAGDNWKNYKRDVNLSRSYTTFLGSFRYFGAVLYHVLTSINYDVVQVINPDFFDLKPRYNLFLFRILRSFNKKIFLGAYGDDYYWVSKCLETDGFRYSNFLLNSKPWDCAQNTQKINKFVLGEFKAVNIEMANQSNGIIACLYEYYVSYQSYFVTKTGFIPLPINTSVLSAKKSSFDGVIRFFIGIDKRRTNWKGSDIMYRALIRIAENYPDECVIVKAESVPFYQYIEMMENSDVLLDQLYSYTPAMNALLAMARGLVVVGGGEEENYEILGEERLRPIINTLPSEADLYLKLEWLILNKQEIPRLSLESIEYVNKHHNHIDVARRYVEFWESH